MMNIPELEVFENHGLYEIDVDIEGRVCLGQSAAGWATFRPNTEESSSVDAAIDCTNRRVKFYWCPADDVEAARHFRRSCQVWVIDSLARRHEAEDPATIRKEALAWWEDTGLWLITDEPKTDSQSLGRWWTGKLGGPRIDGANRETAIGAETETRHGDVDGQVYADLCDLFVSMTRCSQRLHRSGLVPLTTTMNMFSVLLEAPLAVDIARYPNAFALSDYASEAISSDTPIQNSTLFSVDPLDRSNRLNDQNIKRHLRYLAPEVVGTRVMSAASDIFALGVVFYEVLTGTTIDGGPDTPDVMTIDVLQDFQRHVLLVVAPPGEVLAREAAMGSYHANLPPSQLSDIIMKCIAKNTEDRYASIEALCYDVNRLAQVVRAHGDLSKFQVGEVDRISRFALPSEVVHRAEETNTLNRSLHEAAALAGSEAWSSKGLTVYGLSGAGKTRVLLEWARSLEEQAGGRKYLLSYAKIDEHINRPLASFTQLFDALLERILTDGREEVDSWRQRIHELLGSQLDAFLRLLSPSNQRLLAPSRSVKRADSIEWANFLPAFKRWSARLLQLFGTESRPLVLIVDDCQWLESSEVAIWRNLLDGPNALNFVLMVAAYRVESDRPPAETSSLSPGSTTLHIQRLPEEGVAEMIHACFHGALDQAQNLASFLFAETAGSPLYLRSLITTLVSENILRFDFERLLWRYDPLALQSHLTNSQVDTFLAKVIRGFPEEVQDVLFILSCLPSAGVPTCLLADIVGRPLLDVEASLNISSTAGWTLIVDPNNKELIKFSHDRYRGSSFGLIPPDEQADTLLKVSQHLSRPAHREQYLLVAADLALNAKNKGRAGDVSDFMDLMLAAAEKSTQHASFQTAKRFLDGYESLVVEAGNVEGILSRNRSGYFRYLQLVSQVYGVLRIASEADAKVRETIPHCKTPAEAVKLALYRVRVKIWTSEYTEATDILLEALRQRGYDVERPEQLHLRAPRLLEEVRPFVDSLKEVDHEDDTDIRILLSTLIADAGPTIFSTLPHLFVTIFTLAIHFMGEVGIVQETAPYLLSVYPLTLTDVPVREAICEAAQVFALKRPASKYSPTGLLGRAAQAHCWTSFDHVAKSMSFAFNLIFAHGNYEFAAYAVGLDLSTQLFASRTIDWKLTETRYKAVKPVASKVMNATMGIPLNYSENFARWSPSKQPWLMEGSFLSDTAVFRNLSIQESMWHCCSLRLAILYDAPLDTQLDIIAKGTPHVEAAASLVYGPEWEFHSALTLMRTDPADKRIDQACETLRKVSGNIDFANSLKVLNCLMLLYRDTFRGIVAVDQLCRELESDSINLHGMLSLLAGLRILDATGSETLASGYFVNASRSLVSIGGEGVCQMLQKRFPAYVSGFVGAIEPSFLSIITASAPSTPPLRRAPPSASNATTRTTDSESLPPDDTVHADSLDTVTLMRSSLALASEHDPQVLMATLLRVLCQYIRADYAAIALADSDDAETFRLVASGSYDRITTRDITLSDENAQTVCPSSLMLKVARTNKPMIKISSSSPSASRVWNDSFYNDRAPKTALCLPISAQGRQAGVIMLSSMVVDNPLARSTAAREVVSCLATFATLAALNQGFTQRLKREVDERTKQLQDALAAKTQFLSQCSHELRSPLSAVLGLATVLRESPGLSEVQREHLQTIQSSGEDLLGLINNILDVSRLENSSVTLERTPFAIRDVVEAALDTLASSAQTKNLEVCLVSSFRSDPPGVYGDSFRIKQVLLNLLSNAVKFTSKGKVTVRWEHESKPDNRVLISLVVEDTGIGIPAQKMDKLFRSFSQVDESITRSYGGSGLGLVISRDLARLMGGDCTAESEYGKGSKFTFTFLAERNDSAKMDYEVFRSPRSCFVLCPVGPSWPMLQANLEAFNCQPVRFEAKLEEGLQKDFPEGLNSNHDFHFVFVDVTLITPDNHREMRRLQPKAKFVYMCNSIDLAKAMKRFDLTRESILARPIKLASLYNVLIPEGDADTPNRPKMQGRSRVSKNKVNKGLAQEAPLKILLVDDNNTNLLVGRRILEMLGYKNIPSANNGLQGFEEAEKTQYDLVLMDLQMPVMDGFTSLERIQASPLTGSPCVVALTANADMATQKRCEEAGFFTYLSKPLNIANFETTLRTVYQHRQGGANGNAIDPNKGPNQGANDAIEPTEVNNAKAVEPSTVTAVATG